MRRGHNYLIYCHFLYLVQGLTNCFVLLFLELQVQPLRDGRFAIDKGCYGHPIVRICSMLVMLMWLCLDIIGMFFKLSLHLWECVVFTQP
jgi:hypothetical protein